MSDLQRSCKDSIWHSHTPHTGISVANILHCCCCSAAKLCLTLCDPHGLQHTRLPCPSPSPGVCSNSWPLSWWCHPTISSSAAPFSPALSQHQVFYIESALPIRWPKYWSFNFSISPSNEYQGWFPLGLTGLMSLLSAQLFIINLVSIIQLLPSWPVATSTRSQMFCMHIGSTLLATHLAGFDQQEEGFCFCPNLPSIDWNVPINPLH